MLSTGQATVVTAGVRVQLGTGVVNSGILVKALSTNTGIVYVGNSTVSSSNGFPLSADQVLVLDKVGKLSDIYVDASVNTQKVAYMTMDLV
jgi:hypothetical protein